MTEEWKAVGESKGLLFPNHEVSNLGRVRVLRPGRKPRLLKSRINSKPTNYGYVGYEQVDLYEGGRSNHRVLVHRLVAKAFVDGETEARYEVNHINGVRTDNSAANLNWMTPSENIRDSRIRKPGRWNHSSKITEEQVLLIRSRCNRNDCRGRKELARELGISLRTMRGILNGDSWQHIPDKAKDSKCRGEAHSQSKLTDVQVADIRQRYVPYKQGCTSSALASEYGVSASSILDVVHNISYNYSS